MQVDWLDQAWQRALERAVEVYGPSAAGEVVLDGAVVFVRCRGSCRGDVAWHRVEGTDGKLACDCPSRIPCVHRARAWASWLHDWDTIKGWSRWFGPKRAVAGVVWTETGVIEAAFVGPLAGAGVERRPDGSVMAVTPHYPANPTGRYARTFEYGYRGAGCQELAYVLLAHGYGPTLADERRSLLVEALTTVPREQARFVVSADAIHAVARGRAVRYDAATATVVPAEVL